MSPDGPIEAEIQSAHYPAGPNWWLGPDDLWHPPPEPQEPPGTVHQVGERKRTWEGTVEWNGESWMLLDDVVTYAHPATILTDTQTDRRELASRIAAFAIIAVAAALSLSRFFPVVLGTAACNSNQLASPASVLACTPNFNATYHYGYSWWGLSATYDPWFDPASPNGKEVLFYFVALTSVIWAVRVLRQRTSKRRLILGTGLITALAVTADIVNLLQLSRFKAEWAGQQSFCGGLTCQVTVQYPVVWLTLGLSIALVLLFMLSLASIEKDVAHGRYPTKRPSPASHRVLGGSLSKSS